MAFSCAGKRFFHPVVRRLYWQVLKRIERGDIQVATARTIVQTMVRSRTVFRNDTYTASAARANKDRLEYYSDLVEERRQKRRSVLLPKPGTKRKSSKAKKTNKKKKKKAKTQTTSVCCLPPSPPSPLPPLFMPPLPIPPYTLIHPFTHTYMYECVCHQVQDDRINKNKKKKTKAQSTYVCCCCWGVGMHSHTRIYICQP